MGSEDLFHKRKAKRSGALARRRPRRDVYTKVLIVCEGEKTEPYYFQGFRDAYSLNTANIEICGDCGSSPVTIYQYARQRYRQEKDAGDPYDRVYCVFDKDSHTSFQQALDKILRSTPRDTFFAITSIPCFEYWISR